VVVTMKILGSLFAYFDSRFQYPIFQRNLLPPSVADECKVCSKFSDELIKM